MNYYCLNSNNKHKGKALQKSKIISIAFLFLVLIFLIETGESCACTCWAAAGDKVEGKGIILAKNRDYLPQPNELRLIVPETGYTYLGLFPVKGQKEQYVVAGINEKGLSVVSMTASSIPHAKRHPVKKGIVESILTSYESVDAVLKDKDFFSKIHPSFYMMGDKTKIAIIEVAPDGRFSSRETDNGILYHTNHYTDETLLWANEKIGKSSQIRLNRIGQLLMSHPTSFTIEDFIIFSEDRNDGPNNSISRTGTAQDREMTLASWIIAIPKNSDPELYLKIANPKEPEKFYNMRLDRSFWTNGLE